MASIDTEMFKNVLRYSAETGLFVWAERPKSMFKDERCWKKWNSRYAGMIAGSKDFYGYIQITARCCGIRRKAAHRLAWLYTYGEFPEKDIDHINGDKSDNRMDNLRLATRKENSRYVARIKSNSSGYKGVCWDRSKDRFQSVICVDGKSIYLGRFRDPIEAAKAYDVAAEKYHGEFALTNKMLGLL